MRLRIALVLTLGWLLLLSVSPATAADPVAGTWEGESKCTVAGSPCRDEHVIYEITPEGSAGRMKLDGYKVVNGEKDFMGALSCEWQAPRLTCTHGGSRENLWEFVVRGTEMTGTLVVGKEKTLYRRVAVKRQR